MQPPHLESEPLFLPADDPEAEGLLRVGPREDEVVDLLHHLARYAISLVVISVGRALLIRQEDGMSERVSGRGECMRGRDGDETAMELESGILKARRHRARGPPAYPKAACRCSPTARAYDMSVVWVWAGPDKGCTVPPFR